MKDRPLALVHLFFTALLVATLLLNVVSPYVGLKFEYSMTMFSNLKTDMSNHLFIPSNNAFGNFEFYVVESLEIESDPLPDHAKNLLLLLDSVSQPTTLTEGILPVHGDLIRYHLVRFNEEGVIARFVLRDAFTGEQIRLDSANLSPSWLRYSIWSPYPMVLHDYRDVHDVVRAIARSKRGDGS